MYDNSLCRIGCKNFSAYVYAVLFIRSCNHCIFHIQRVHIICNSFFGIKVDIQISKRLVSFIQPANPFFLHDGACSCIFPFTEQLAYMSKIRYYIYVFGRFRFSAIKSILIELYSLFLSISKNHSSQTSVSYRQCLFPCFCRRLIPECQMVLSIGTCYAKGNNKQCY